MVLLWLKDDKYARYYFGSNYNKKRESNHLLYKSRRATLLPLLCGNGPGVRLMVQRRTASREVEQCKLDPCLKATTGFKV